METMLFMGALGAIVAVLFKSVFDGAKAAEKPAPQAKTKPATKPKPKVAKKKAAVKAKPTAKKAAASTAKKTKPAPKKAAASTKSKSTAETHQLKNPATGEVVTIPGSYRFVKRWIKDALVEEGLLDKVYKNNELTDAANKKIKTALNKIKAIKKYQA